MNCPNCGRELAEGEVCNCMTTENFPNTPNTETANVQAPPVTEQPTYAVPPVQTPEQPPYQAPQQNYYQPPQGEYYPPNGDPQYAAPPYYAPTPQEVPANTNYPDGYKIKRKYVAVLLGATLGMFGIHNFYLGNSSRGIAQVLLATVGSLFFGLGMIAAYVWSLVETVQILTESIDKDANGYKIQTFEEALVKTRMEAEAKMKQE